MTRAPRERVLLDGPAGKIECVIDLPAAGGDRDKFHDAARDKFHDAARDKSYDAARDKSYDAARDRSYDAARDRSYDAARDRSYDAARGVALVAHPHPLFGGSLDNKVAQTLAKTFVELGYVALRPNFRGVGASAGEHDEGRGEADDLLAILDYARTRFHAQAPVLAGFSFGAYVQTLVARQVQPERMALVGVAAGFVSGGRSYTAEPVPAGSIVIHGELDETVPLSNVLAWARPQELPVIVVPGADHFFHRRLHLIKSIVKGSWRS